MNDIKFERYSFYKLLKTLINDMYSGYSFNENKGDNTQYSLINEKGDKCFISYSSLDDSGINLSEIKDMIITEKEKFPFIEKLDLVFSSLCEKLNNEDKIYIEDEVTDYLVRAYENYIIKCDTAFQELDRSVSNVASFKNKVLKRDMSKE